MSDRYAVYDAYGFQYVPRHLARSGRVEALRGMLFDFDWLRAKLGAIDVNSLIADYDLIPDNAEGHLVQDALRQATHILSRDKTQLPGQLLGRLSPDRAPAVKELLEGAKQCKAATWLRPLTANLLSTPSHLYREFDGHSGRVTAMVALPSRGWIVSASDDNTLGVWDLSTGTKRHTLTGHNHSVKAVAVAPDERYVVSASYDQSLIIWDLERGELLDRLETRATSLLVAVALDAKAQHIVSLDAEGTLVMWDFAERQPLRTVSRDQLSAQGTGLSFDQVSLSERPALVLQAWEYLRKEGVHLPWGLKAWNDRKIAAITAGGTYAILGEDYPDPHAFVLWDLEANGLRHRWKLNSAHDLSVAVTRDNHRLLYGTLDGTLSVWDIANDGLINSWRAHPGAVTAVAVTDDGRYAITGDGNGALRMWSLESVGLQNEPPTASHLTQGIRLAQITADGQRVVAVDDTMLYLFELTDPITPSQKLIPDGLTDVVALVPDKSWAVSASDDQLVIWDIDEKVNVNHLAVQKDLLIDVQLTLDGRYAVVASAGSGKGIKGIRSRLRFSQEAPLLEIWDIERHKLLQKIRVKYLESHVALEKVAISPDGSYAAALVSNYKDIQNIKAGGVTSSLLIYNLKDGSEIAKQRHFTPGERLRLPAIAVTNNGQAVVSDDAVAVAAESGWIVRAQDYELQVNDAVFSGIEPFTDCAVSADGRTIAAIDATGHMHVLRLENGG